MISLAFKPYYIIKILIFLNIDVYFSIFYIYILLLFGLDALDEAKQDTAAHLLQTDIQKRVVNTLGEVGNGFA